MPIATEKLSSLLLETKVITKAKLSEALKIAQKNHQPLEHTLVQGGYIPEQKLGRILAEYYGVRFIDLGAEQIPRQILQVLPELVAKTQRIIVFGQNKNGLNVAMADPGNVEMKGWLEKKTGGRVNIYYATNSAIGSALKQYSKESGDEGFEVVIGKYINQAKQSSNAEDVPVIKLVDLIMEYAYENKVSDVHIEPREDHVLIRFRMDGILHDIVKLPKFVHNLIITRIKVLSNMRTDEHRAAQDGKFRKKVGEEKFDVRVSMVPIVAGEKVVMRLLSERAQQLGLDNLGFSKHDLDVVKKTIDKPHGMTLVTGPTGSGKTTTLYSILKLLNTPEVNISTIEDPVEYELPRVNQIQVNKKTELTFATGLRSIVRQDPDIVMVGEIRDEETAGIAVNSAMTGHLVLSTLHTNDASTSFPRLADMGVQPFLIATAINIVIAQRLVRRICMACIESYEMPVSDLKLSLSDELVDKVVKNKKSVRVYRGKGCKECSFSGYQGRIGIHEVLEVTDEIKRLVMKRATAKEIENQAIEQGMIKMVEDGVEKVFKGVTTIEEVFRVSAE